MSKKKPTTARPLPTVTRDGATYYDFDMFTDKERVAFALREVNAVKQEAAMLRGALGEVSDFVHVLSALVRRAMPLQDAEGTPLGFSAFLEVVKQEAKAYQVAMDPTVTGPAAEALERQSLSHRLQDTLKAARAEGIKVMSGILEKIKADARAEAEKEAASEPPQTPEAAPVAEQKQEA